MNYKLKVKELKWNETLESPRFTISLHQTGTGEKQFDSNYEVLTKLIGDKDLIINFNSTLLNLSEKKREPYIRDFLESIRALNLEYKCNKFPVSDHYNVMGLSFGKKNTEEQEIFVYVPNDIWAGGEFKKILPIYGVRFFITGKNENPSDLLNDTHSILDSEKLDRFELILVSNICLNSMGLFTKYMKLNELNSLLGV